MADPTPSGRWVVSTTAGTLVRAFVPDPLPPTPPLEFTDADVDLIERANRALGRLDGLFLEGVRQTAEQAVATARRLLELFESHRSAISSGLRTRAGNGLMLHDILKRNPVITGATAASLSRLSVPTVNGLLDGFRELGILEEVTKRKRDRIYFYRTMIDVLEAGTPSTS